MYQHRFVASLGLLVALVACHDSTDPPPATPRFVQTTITTTLGAPVPGAYVAIQGWPASPVRPPGIDPLARTDDAGRFVVHLGTYHDLTLDSVRVRWLPPGCFRPTRDTTLYHLSLTADTLSLLVTDSAAGPAAASAPAEYCGFGVSGVAGPDAFRLGLRLDSVVGTQLFGRWRLNYTWTQGDDYGPFVGAQTPGTVELVLTHAAPWGTCRGLRLGAARTAGGQWGPLTALEAQGCVNEPLRFDMVAGQWFPTYP